MDCWRTFVKVLFARVLLAVLASASLWAEASDDTSPGGDTTLGLAILSEPSPLMDDIADEAIRILHAKGIDAERVLRDATLAQVQQSTEPALFLAGLDSLVSAWKESPENNSGASKLLGAFKPVSEVVRDHQAFLMLKTRTAQQLRTVFSRAHGAAGPMSIGGLTPRGQRDHLVAMMLMEAAGQDPVEYPYQAYESLEALAVAMLTGEVRLVSIPVSQALQMPMEGGIEIIATSSNQRQDVMRNVPTLVSARIDMSFADYIGLYATDASAENETLQSTDMPSLFSSNTQWSDTMYELGLVDDYLNQGNFTTNVLRELARMRRLAQMLE